MKNKAILSILLFVFTYTKAEGQTIVYTYIMHKEAVLPGLLREHLQKPRKPQRLL